MTSWTTIPPWLYENDLTDERLQEVYVAQAECKLAECVVRREKLEREIAVLREQRRDGRSQEEWLLLLDDLVERYQSLGDAQAVERSARTFLARARAALAHYRQRRRLARG